MRLYRRSRHRDPETSHGGVRQAAVIDHRMMIVALVHDRVYFPRHPGVPPREQKFARPCSATMTWRSRPHALDLLCPVPPAHLRGSLGNRRREGRRVDHQCPLVTVAHRTLSSSLRYVHATPEQAAPAARGLEAASSKTSLYCKVLLSRSSRLRKQRTCGVGQSLFGARNMRFMIRKCNLLQRKEAGQPPIKLMRRSCRGAEMWERRCPKCSTKLQKKNPADTVRCNCGYEWK